MLDEYLPVSGFGRSNSHPDTGVRAAGVLGPLGQHTVQDTVFFAAVSCLGTKKENVKLYQTSSTLKLPTLKLPKL